MNKVKEFKAVLDIFDVLAWIMILGSLIAACSVVVQSGVDDRLIWLAVGVAVFMYIAKVLMLGLSYCVVQIAINTRRN